MSKFKLRKTLILVLSVLLTFTCYAQDIISPRENIVWAQMSFNSSSLLINEWKKKISKEKNNSSKKIEELERKIKDENLWLQDMQSILDGKLPSGEGINLHRLAAQQAISNYSKNDPVYCNLKNVLRIYDRLEKAKPIGSYSCE